MQKVVVFVTDLFFEVKIRTAARNLNVELEFGKSLDGLAGSIPEFRTIIVDLKLTGVNLEEFLGEIKKRYPNSRIIAFGPHGETDLWRIAKKAGVDQMMARSKFSQKLFEILQSASQPDSAIS
jgi:DNA-binding NarL/FixJ family response regulator